MMSLLLCVSGPRTFELRCCLCKVRKLSDFIKNLNLCVRWWTKVIWVWKYMRWVINRIFIFGLTILLNYLTIVMLVNVAYMFIFWPFVIFYWYNKLVFASQIYSPLSETQKDLGVTLLTWCLANHIVLVTLQTHKSTPYQLSSAPYIIVASFAWKSTTSFIDW